MPLNLALESIRMRKHPFLFFVVLVLGGLAIFTLLAYGSEQLVRYAQSYWVEIFLSAILSALMDHAFKGFRAEAWQIWAEEHGYKILKRERVRFDRNVHKSYWRWKEIWQVQLETEGNIRSAFVTIGGRAYPEEIVWC